MTSVDVIKRVTRAKKEGENEGEGGFRVDARLASHIGRSKLCYADSLVDSWILLDRASSFDRTSELSSSSGANVA